MCAGEIKAMRRVLEKPKPQQHKLDSRVEFASLPGMRRLVLIAACVILPLTVCAFRVPLGAVAPAGPERPAAELSVGDAVLLGLVEGITEFLPISSTGHLIIANHALHLDATAPLHDAQGRPLWYTRPSAKRPEGEPLTLKLAADTYSVIIQFGAIAAVLLLYWSRLVGILRGLIGEDAAGLRLLGNLLIAFLPAAVLGLLLNRWIDGHLFSVLTVIIAQVAGAVLMLAVERWRRNRAAPEGSGLPLEALPARRALGIGLMQCLALWPGTSRSMTTIVGGYFAGFEPRVAAEFSFLLGLVTLTAATVYKGYSSGMAMIAVFGWPHVILGIIVATVSAAAAVKFLVGYLGRHGLALFAWYRFATAAALALFYLL